MSGKLQLIEQKLQAINQAKFQSLCDSYLTLSEPGLSSLNRTGSQIGKEKTIKGTPDTFFRNTDGNLICVEYTTQIANLVQKIIEDIDKCLIKISEFGEDKISIIYYFCNSRLSLNEDKEIISYANKPNLKIKLIPLDQLANGINSKYQNLANEFLDISIDTGQILTIESFIKEYNSKGGNLSTPVDNIFLHRKLELEEALKILESEDFIILSGPAGIGKTKFALGLSEQFLITNNKYTAYVISNKNNDIWEDLKIQLQNDKDYILIIDDANRQIKNFTQILAIFKEGRIGKIKIVVTVRDYAYKEILKECIDYESKILKLEKFTDEEIREIIKSEQFKILNSTFQDKVIELSDGNARLAVMCSILANTTQQKFLYENSANVYESYFNTFIKDSNILNEPVVLKTLGIISFFYRIDLTNRVLLDIILSDFNLDYCDFLNSINKLDEMELVEIQYDHAKVSEQIMSEYFFYKVFIADKILNFETLLFNYFDKFKLRFDDTIIPVNNNFGFEALTLSINPALDKYLETFKSEDTKIETFFETFWFCKPLQTIDYFQKLIVKIPEPENPEYNTFYERNDFFQQQDLVISHLTRFFNFYSEHFVLALQLLFEYCRKTPSSLPELVRRIRERISFDTSDERFGFKKQIELFNFLETNTKNGDLIFIKAFFALTETFLQHTFSQIKNGRGRTVNLLEYPFPLNVTTQELRKQIWTNLFELYPDYSFEIIEIIKKYRHPLTGFIKELLIFDLDFILPFIENNLDKNNFNDVHLVQEFCYLLDNQNLDKKSYEKLRKEFINLEYTTFKKLNINSRNYKEYTDNYDWAKLEKLIDEELRKNFVFKHQTEFQDFNIAIKNTLELKKVNWYLKPNLDIICEENYILNSVIGYQLIENLIKNYLGHFKPFDKTIKLIANSDIHNLSFWKMLKKAEGINKIEWQIAFLELLGTNFVNKFYLSELKEILSNINSHFSLRLDLLENFYTGNNQVLIDILNILKEKMEINKLNISFEHDFFKKYTNNLRDNIELLCELYLFQEEFNDCFDFEKKGLCKIIEIDQQFLIRYITKFYGNENTTNRHEEINLGFVWGLVNSNIIEECVEIVVKNNIYSGIGEYEELAIFFKGLNLNQKVIAEDFINDYLIKNNKDSHKINVIFDIIRHNFNQSFEKFMLLYLNYNNNVVDFEKIWWYGNGGVYEGDVNFGEIEKENLMQIKNIVENSTNKLLVLPIMIYLEQKIQNSENYAEAERKARFVNPNW